MTRRTIRLSPWLLLLAFIAGCGDSSNDNFVFTNSNLTPNRRVFAVYMVGSDLESKYDSGTDDLLEMADGLASLTATEKENLALLIAFGGADQDGWRGVKVMDAQGLLTDASDGIFGNEAPEVYLFSEDGRNMGDPATLTQFLSAVAVLQSGSERSFVDLWNHGGSYKGFGVDENHDNDALGLEEMTQSFANAGVSRFDLVGFDACLMASVEVAQAFQGTAGLLVASEETEPAHGWNYRHVVPAYVRMDDTVDYAKSLVDNYVDPASHPFEDSGKTLSVLDLDQFSAFAAKLDAYGSDYSAALQAPGAQSAFARAVTSSQAFGIGAGRTRYSIDLEDFIAQSAFFGVPNQNSAGDLLNSLENFVVYVQNDGSLDATNGVSIIPPDKTALGVEPSLLAQNGWRTLVAFVLNLLSSDTSGPTLIGVFPTAEGYEAEYEDQLLTHVDVVHGISQPDGRLLELFREEADPIPLTSRWFVEDWDGTALHLVNGAQSQPLPIQFLRFERYDGRPAGIYGARISLLESTDPGGGFDQGTLLLAIDEDGSVIEYGIRTSLTDEEGDEVEGKTIEQLHAGDQLKLFARFYDGGPETEPEFEEFASLTLTGEPQFQVQPVVVGIPGGLAVVAEDLACNVNLTLIDLLPPGTP